MKMAPYKDIIVAIKLFPSHSDKIADGNRQNLTTALINCLQETAQLESSRDHLLLLRFKKLATAYLSVFACLQRIKSGLDQNFGQSKLPLLILFHYPTKYIDIPDAFQVSESSLWDGLEHEVLYVTTSLKEKWHKLLDGSTLPSHLFQKIDDKLFQVRFSAKGPAKQSQYFPQRDLPVQGKRPKCFYCGMKNHPPAQCPAKQLPPELQGVRDVGYLSIATIAKCYKKVFSDFKRQTEIIATGISYSEIRKDPVLLVLVTFLDLSKVYQPRFLFNLAFNKTPVWKNFLGTFTSKQDNRNLAMGFDCLRVGQYPQAKEMFEKELTNPFGKGFYATVGQAFIALETGRTSDLRHYLRKAKILADNEKEKVYIGLLSTRLEVVSNDLDSASEVLAELAGTVFQCIDAKYAQVQIEVNRCATEQTCTQLRNFIEDQAAYFIMILFDPFLLPFQGFVDEMLADIFQEKERAANLELLAVRKTRDNLMIWADTKDNDLQTNLHALEEMEKKFSHNTIYDHLDVSQKCNGLNYAFKQISQKQIDRMSQGVQVLTGRYNKLLLYWKGYSYQSFFKGFSEKLNGLKKRLNQLSSLVESDKGRSLRAARKLLATINHDFAELEAIVRKMSLLETTAKGALIFGKTLLIIEVLFIVIGLLLFGAANTRELGGFLNGAAVGSLVSFATIIAAPFIAFLTTLLTVTKKYF